MHLSYYQSRFPRQYDTYYKFTFVRNPWDRVVSLYNRREGIQCRGHMTFEQFVDNIQLCTDTCTQQGLKPVRNQYDFCHINNIQHVDYIGRFENIQRDYDKICDTVGIPRERLPHANKTSDRHYSTYYNDDTRQIIGQKFAIDIDRFGYKYVDIRETIS